jgi:hypothetical protein
VTFEGNTESGERGVGGSQRVRALERANRVRFTRSRVKAQIAAGELTPAEVILSARWEIGRMPLAELLGSQPQWGAVRCRAFLARLHIVETKTIASMTQRQRLATAAALNRDPTKEAPTPDVLAASTPPN